MCFSEIWKKLWVVPFRTCGQFWLFHACGPDWRLKVDAKEPPTLFCWSWPLSWSKHQRNSQFGPRPKAKRTDTNWKFAHVAIISEMKNLSDVQNIKTKSLKRKKKLCNWMGPHMVFHPVRAANETSFRVAHWTSAPRENICSMCACMWTTSSNPTRKFHFSEPVT